MSQDQNAVIQTGPPRRFLRKGEGLKRFAAYKPPLPTTAKKVVQRRQTFVRFKLDRNSANITKEPCHFLPPELLNDDSINLSTEIPKIAPPKIIHTPIRPNRNALGTVTNQSSLFTDSQVNGNIDNLFKKIEERKNALEEKTDTSFFEDHTDSFNCQGMKQEPAKNVKGNLKPVPKDTHADNRDVYSSKKLESSNETSRIVKPRRTVQPPKRPSPVSEISISDLTKHIDRIESTVNELKEKLKDCACCTPNSPPTTRRRPTTRAAARAAKSKESDTKSPGPSADADKITTKERLDGLAKDFAQLRARLDEFQCKK